MVRITPNYADQRDLSNHIGYEGCSINKLQNGAIPPVLKIGKIRNIRFVGNLILNLNIHTTFLDDDVIIVTSSDNRTQSICVLFSASVYYRNSQVINPRRPILSQHGRYGNLKTTDHHNIDDADCSKISTDVQCYSLLLLNFGQINDDDDDDDDDDKVLDYGN